MKKWQSDVRGAGFILLLWLVGWGLGFGGIMEIVDPRGEIQDVWPSALAIVGLVGGFVFAGLLRVAEGPRSFDEVTLARGAAWGGVAGLALAAVAMTKIAGPVSSVISHVFLALAGTTGAGEGQPRAFVAISILAALGAVAGFGTMVFFRLLARRQASAPAQHRA